ncbi:microfibrillar-associated protein 1-like [Pyrus ussuriensis x Pyrus communis]|uniref:Microfibrillar-associated protein 1-like n=1 Tax=Pyrus ussuriensis x Pyrus communis TaxID=2448454 RepID=A0A5N5GX88_9ROSA|nr:microfibrillar-associated protein 1-like [Pyrus ussuriensis x Pyrus communis]
MSLQREQEDEAPLLPSEDEEEEEKSEHTIAERVQLEAEEWALEEPRKKKLEERKRKTKQIVVEEIWKDKGLDQEVNIVAGIDSDDEVNEAEEYEAWKAREIVRIKSDREDREAMLKEEEETEKVRNMTEEEGSEWERTNLKPAPQPKQKWMFMQKYYHKGAFFQSEADGYATKAGTDGIYARHYSAPTGEAKMDINCPKSLIHCKCRESRGLTLFTRKKY